MQTNKQQQGTDSHTVTHRPVTHRPNHKYQTSPRYRVLGTVERAMKRPNPLHFNPNELYPPFQLMNAEIK